jgi:tetratricopeptide (TPR) repeat protein
MPEPPVLALEGVDVQVARAVEAERARVRQQPRSVEAWGRLGKLLFANGFPREALECFAVCARLDPADPRWPYYRGMGTQVEDPEVALGHFRRAAELCDKAAPENLAPRLTLVEQLLSRGQLDQAERELDRAFLGGESDARVRFDRGALAVLRGQWEAGRSLLAPLVNHPAARRRSATQLAMACQRLGRTEEAARYAEAAVSGPEDDAWPDPFAEEYLLLAISQRGGLARATAHDASLDAKAAREELLQLVKEFGDRDYHVHVRLGSHLAARRQFAQAEQSLRRALALGGPNRFRVVYLLGLVLNEQAEQLQREGATERSVSKRRAAEGFLRRAVLLNPGEAWSNYECGRVLAALGNHEAALGHFRTAAASRPEVSTIQRALGEALARQGQLDDARTHLERAVRCAAPDDQTAAEALRQFEQKHGRGR